MHKDSIYISTNFLDCEIKSVNYKICYEFNKYGKHFIGISKVKIEDAIIHIKWTKIYQFLKYYFDKNKIFYPAKPEEWDDNLGKDEFFFFSQLYEEEVNVEFGKIKFPDITYDNLIYISPDLILDSELDLEPDLKKIVSNLEKPLIKEIIKYSCPQLKINVYPVKHIYWLLEEIVNKIIKKVIKKIETDILYKEIFEYHYLGREIKNFYRYDIDLRRTLRRTSVGSLSKKYAKYNKTIIEAIKMIETELVNFIGSENFVKMVEEHVKEKTTLEEFLKELKENFRFWDKFYDEFCNKYLRNSESAVRTFPILKHSNWIEVKCFIIPKIHKKAFQAVKNRLLIFAL